PPIRRVVPWEIAHPQRGQAHGLGEFGIVTETRRQRSHQVERLDEFAVPRQQESEMKNRDIAKPGRSGPARAGPCAKLSQGVVVFAGFVFAEAEEGMRRAAVHGTAEKALEGDGCFGKTILIVE